MQSNNNQNSGTQGDNKDGKPIPKSDDKNANKAPVSGDTKGNKDSDNQKNKTDMEHKTI